MNYTFSFEKCQTCGKEILVERQLIGVDHTLAIIISCKECLKKKPIPERFEEQHPEEYKSIMKWLKK